MTPGRSAPVSPPSHQLVKERGRWSGRYKRAQPADGAVEDVVGREGEEELECFGDDVGGRELVVEKRRPGDDLGSGSELCVTAV